MELSGAWRSLNWPNRISLVRLLGIPPFVLLLLKQHDWPAARYLAMVVFVVIGASDALDGYLARRSGQITRLGSILDPLADKALITCAVILLATDRAAVPDAKLADWVVVAVVGKDLLVVIGFFVLFLVTGQVKVHPSRIGKACTVMQVVMVAAVLAAPDINYLARPWGTRLAWALGAAVTALSVLAVIGYTRLGLALLAQHDQSVTRDEQPKG